MNAAIEEDIDQAYLKAIQLYEKNIENETNDSNDFVNLAFIYWAAAALEIEFNTPNNIPAEISLLGGKRFLTILDLGLKYFPFSSELHFWKRYFKYRLFSEEFSEYECLELISKYPDGNLTPYFFLHLFNNKKHTTEIHNLIKICKHIPTAKNIYILSFLEY